MFTLCGCGQCRRLLEVHTASIFRVEAGEHLGIPVADDVVMHLRGFVFSFYNFSSPLSLLYPTWHKTHSSTLYTQHLTHFTKSDKDMYLWHVDNAAQVHTV
jgi:hypothetical protein